MSGSENAHGHAGGYDLLRRATQAMMSKTATPDEDCGDQIGYETPRSGIATPQPDLHDKRLPGIMSYFGQVRQTQSRSTSNTNNMLSSSPFTAIRPPLEGALPSVENSAPTADQRSRSPSHSQSRLSPALGSGALSPSDSRNGKFSDAELLEPLGARSQTARGGHSTQGAQHENNPYPTPPTSTPSSGHKSLEQERKIPSASSTPAPPSPQSTSMIPDREVSGKPAPSLKPAGAQPPSQNTGSWFSLDGIKELTRGALFKSGPPTPTRALSAAHPSQADKGSVSSLSIDGAEKSGTQTPRASPSTGGQAPAAKGKMTIKIPEARGLRSCRDPYVVVVFQRSELISGGPRVSQEEDTLSVTPSRFGGVPIQRQGSDSGRTPMSIPMRSRQSSNTSNGDSKPARPRNARTSFTNPQWDAEAIFDVVESNMSVDISVYSHTASGDDFLGHVQFQASKDEEGTKGWYALQGHADTMAEDAPTGEIYVESKFQKSEKKHYGPTDFEILKLIGKGTFGQVYQVRKKDTRRIYAMKVLQKKVIVQKKEVAHTVGERNILVRTAMADSPFIVGLKFSFQTPSELYLVTDYMSGGELFWHLQKEGRFDERRAKFYIAELILAIQHLHNNDIVYRDLKPENILLDANGHIALCDFGLSKANLTKNDTTNTFCGTTEYLAPEVLMDESGYTKMVDFWSLGVLVFEMCCGWSPFYAEDTQQMYKNIAYGKVRFPRETLSQEGRSFVKGLLNRNPRHRLGATNDAQELKEHPFFADIDWTLLAKKLISPPFKPKLKSETDVSYFDPEFTTALDTNGSLNERAAALARGYAASTPLSPSVQANFQGFTFVDESALDDHMRDRPVRDDEEMDDARRSDDDDDDWDNLDDIDPRKANRMSGIMKSGPHDEQMVGGSHFDM